MGVNYADNRESWPGKSGQPDKWIFYLTAAKIAAMNHESFQRRRTETADGVPAEAGGPSPEPQDLLAMRDFGGPARASGRDFESDPLVAVLGAPGDTFRDQLVAGQALQRVLLTATEHRLAVSLLSQPIEVPAARDRLRRGLGRLGAPQMVLRIGYGQPGFPTPRRPVSEVIDEASAVHGLGAGTPITREV